MPLIIVESPTKARTFNRILTYQAKKEQKKSEYFVFATMGHMRDLPADRIAIDYTRQFKPTYQVMENKKKVVDQLNKLVAENKEIILATDLDREGESIAYHTAYLINLVKEDWPDAKIKTDHLKRIVFHEITPKALYEALEHPGSLRMDLVKAQQSRRILDRIVGYELSPLLWKKMGKNWLSAGRVQSVALRLIVEREKEIRLFKIEPYFQIFGLFADAAQKAVPLRAKLISFKNENYEQKFSLTLFAGTYQYTKTTISKENVETIQKTLEKEQFTVENLKEETVTRYPPPPFTTSLLTQDAFYKYGFSSKMTMRLAQDLYERGVITYHRTDSFNLSAQFVFGAKDYIAKEYGVKYALDKPRGFKTKSRMAQEAHEAIRPTKFDPKAAEKSDEKTWINHKRLYRLIFDRSISTQMKEATIKKVTVTIISGKEYRFQADLDQVVFDGFFKVLNPAYVKSHQILPQLTIGQQMNLSNLETIESATKPPPRYNEASLIRILEEKGIGRPSTYAPIISLIQDKHYTEKQFRYFVPTKLGEAISDYLAASFPQIFNLDFTATMENKLDEVASGSEDFIKLLSDFYTPFQDELKKRKLDTSVIDVEEEIDEKCPKCGAKLVIRYSKFGKFMACSRYPNCKFTKPFLYFIPGRFCPEDKGRMVVRFTKNRKKFYGCENYPKCKYSAWKLGQKKV